MFGNSAPSVRMSKLTAICSLPVLDSPSAHSFAFALNVPFISIPLLCRGIRGGFGGGLLRQPCIDSVVDEGERLGVVPRLLHRFADQLLGLRAEFLGLAQNLLAQRARLGDLASLHRGEEVRPAQ